MTRNRVLRYAALPIAIGMLAAACGDDEETVTTEAPAASDAPPPTRPPRATEAPGATEAPAGTDAAAARHGGRLPGDHLDPDRLVPVGRARHVDPDARRRLHDRHREEVDHRLAHRLRRHRHRRRSRDPLRWPGDRLRRPPAPRCTPTTASPSAPSASTRRRTTTPRSPTIAVVGTLEKNPQIVMWDPGHVPRRQDHRRPRRARRHDQRLPRRRLAGDPHQARRRAGRLVGPFATTAPPPASSPRKARSPSRASRRPSRTSTRTRSPDGASRSPSS